MHCLYFRIAVTKYYTLCRFSISIKLKFASVVLFGGYPTSVSFDRSLDHVQFYPNNGIHIHILQKEIMYTRCKSYVHLLTSLTGTNEGLGGDWGGGRGSNGPSSVPTTPAPFFKSITGARVAALILRWASVREAFFMRRWDCIIRIPADHPAVRLANGKGGGQRVGTTDKYP